MLYGIVDCARDKRLYSLVSECEFRACLFSGNLERKLEMVSPHIVLLSEKQKLQNIWQTEGWGKAWGILCRSSKPIEELRKHFRNFLQVELPSGKKALFRFYDPRVWRVYWSTLSEAEKRMWSLGEMEFLVEPGVAS